MTEKDNNSEISDTGEKYEKERLRERQMVKDECSERQLKENMET